MKSLALWCFLALFLSAMIAGASQPANGHAIVNLMIDAQNFSSTDRASDAERSLEAITNLIMDKNLTATIFSAQDILETDVDLDITRLGLDPRFELAMSGKDTNEKISTLSYDEQSALLKASKKYVEAAKICGQNDITVYGFMPQSFNQNQDTYRALDALGIQYDAGFQAGLIYEHGHKSDVWPYQVEGFNFYAVPVSTYNISGKAVPLRDSYFEENGMDANQWYEALASKFDEIQGKDEPLVISLTTSVSGSGDYFDALDKFLDYAMRRDASFVTAVQLVEMAKTGVRDPSALKSAINFTAGCTTCSESGIKMDVAVTNTSECLTCNKDNISTDQATY